MSAPRIWSIRCSAGHGQDIHLDKLMETARDVGSFFNRELPGFILKAGSIVNFKKSAIKESQNETTGKGPRPRPDQRAFRALRHHAPGPAGRRGDQDREPRRRRPGPQAGQRQPPQQAADGHQLPGPERQQEIADPQPEVRGRQGDLPQAAQDRRRGGGEFPPRRHGQARLLLRKDLRRSTPRSFIAPSPASARPAPMPSSRPTTRSSRACPA